ncbi:LacI family DNA-binding transcriptional regulator [Granulicella rosea]|nr:LacI family DNA-binding transcriptional regulator [Granulicella rosea]
MARRKLLPIEGEAERRMDIRTVAAEAGVSIATVSRVMNHVKTVDPKLSKRVWEVVNRLGYVPNTQARALVSGRSRLFGVIISDITNPFFPELIQGFEEKAVEVGYETMIGSTKRDLKQMELCIQRMLERKVDGVAVMTFGIEPLLLERLSLQGIPMVFIDVAPPGHAITPPPGKAISTISIDYEKGIREGVQHLAVLGHRRIGFLAGPRYLHTALAREHAFRRSIQAIGLALPEEYVFEGDHTAEVGMDGMSALLALADPPTAVMCSNDMTAIGAMHTALGAGLRIPHDLSVIGFDDIRLAQYMFPPMTSIQMSRRDLASAAVMALKAHIDESEDHPAPSNTGIETRLVVRQTTSIPRGALSDLKPGE